MKNANKRRELFLTENRYVKEEKTYNILIVDFYNLVSTLNASALVSGGLHGE